MDPATTDPQPREARMLAAIVFTDVVGFSKLASVNEARVYVALQRDMAVMTNLCRSHGGQVLNTMGDGMLLCFTSAVDALSCAVEIQRTLYNQAQSLPSIEVLHHRIGVHLGDVIMNGDNVFGDGVNVAARLQALAKPDAVCFSSTVYEIVKNKLKVDATYLGPRQLKNLGEPVKVWQVPPLGDGRLVTPSDDLPAMSATPPAAGVAGWKAGLLVMASLVLLGGLGFGVSRLKKPPPAMVDRPSKTGKTSGDTQGSDARGGTVAPPVVASHPFTRAEFDKLKSEYKFDDLVAKLTKDPWVAPEESANTFKQLRDLDSFRVAQLSRATSLANPISVPLLTFPGSPPAPAKVYLQGNELMAQSDGMGVVSIAPQGQLSPQNYIEIVSAMADSSTPPPNVAELLQLFSKEYSVSVPTAGA
ncbi:adenylate/guanylate cyclase domain-containing protein [Fimbriimonas ginsengisoli]|uniref:TIR protein (Modular protein) n=1 Tax=Fimbriimonas ginsengisoli Gsoil 348 TaxID=661478 RepID=A0A068NYG2_FIMGI|nr:adenylate/guanylate cyclase domain-containing protein [Fimbriimonas ginsengisoli]AIE88100.1 TIR protein (modular protein) [Fimbriimonas ginsengisoli Gsoil 348]